MPLADKIDDLRGDMAGMLFANAGGHPGARKALLAVFEIGSGPDAAANRFEDNRRDALGLLAVDIRIGQRLG